MGYICSRRRAFQTSMRGQAIVLVKAQFPRIGEYKSGNYVCVWGVLNRERRNRIGGFPLGNMIGG